MEKDHLYAILIVGVVALFALGVLFKDTNFEATGYAYKLPTSKYTEKDTEKKKEAQQEESKWSFLQRIVKRRPQSQQPPPSEQPSQPPQEQPPAQPRQPPQEEQPQAPARAQPQQTFASEFSELCNRNLYYGTQLYDCNPGINDGNLRTVLAEGTFQYGSENRARTPYRQQIAFQRENTGLFTFDNYQGTPGSYIRIATSIPFYRYDLTFTQPLLLTDKNEITNRIITIQGKQYAIDDAEVTNRRVESLTLRNAQGTVTTLRQGSTINGGQVYFNNDHDGWRGVSYVLQLLQPSAQYLRPDQTWHDPVLGGFKFIFRDVFESDNPVRYEDIVLTAGSGGSATLNFIDDRGNHGVLSFITQGGVVSIRDPFNIELRHEYTTQKGARLMIYYDDSTKVLRGIRFEEARAPGLEETQRLQGSDALELRPLVTANIIYFTKNNPNRGFGLSTGTGNVFTSYKGTKITTIERAPDRIENVRIQHPRNRVYAKVLIAGSDY